MNYRTIIFAFVLQLVIPILGFTANTEEIQLHSKEDGSFEYLVCESNEELEDLIMNTQASIDEKQKLAKKYFKCALIASSVSAFASVASVPFISQVIYDNSAAIVFGLAPPALAASPFIAAGIWQLRKARKIHAEISAYLENE